MKFSHRHLLPLAFALCLGLAAPADSSAASSGDDGAHEGGASGSIGRQQDKDRGRKAARAGRGDAARDDAAKAAGSDDGRRAGKAKDDDGRKKRKADGEPKADARKDGGRKAASGKDADARDARRSAAKDDARKDGKRRSVRKNDDRDGSGGASARERKKVGKDGRDGGSRKRDRKRKAKGDPQLMTESSGERSLWLERARGNAEIFTGIASWYSNSLHNSETASGCNYDMYTFTAAHRTLPLGTVVRVTDRANGRSVMVCVTDRGPYVAGRIIDLSYAAARKLRLQDRGIGKVDLEVVSDENGAPLRNEDAYFIRYPSGTGGGKLGPFRAFADAAAMHEAVRTAHPEAEVVLDRTDAASE